MTRTGAMYDPHHPDSEERYASDFAACLLMPEEAFRYAWKRLTEQGCAIRVIRMSLWFGVPPEAVHYRLSMLGLAG